MERRSKFNFLLTNEFKSNTSILLSLFAIVWYTLNPSRERELCMFAILFSTVADFVLMDYNNIPGLILGKKRFYVGMAIFGITHILYACCFFKLIPGELFEATASEAACIASLIVFISSIALSTDLAIGKDWVFRIATYGYTVLINIALATMYICAELLGGRYFLAAIGITLFLLSDMLILVRETKKDTTLIRKLIWVFYPIGQVLIVLSV